MMVPLHTTRAGRLLPLLLLAVVLTFRPSTTIAIAQSGADAKTELWIESGSALSAWSYAGIQIGSSESSSAASLAWRSSPTITCAGVAIDGGSAQAEPE